MIGSRWFLLSQKAHFFLFNNNVNFKINKGLEEEKIEENVLESFRDQLDIEH